MMQVNNDGKPQQITSMLIDEWNEYINSEDGQLALKLDTLTCPEFLYSRLWHAFLHGSKANKKIEQ